MDRLTKWDPDHGWIENHDNDTREWKNGNRACMEKLAAFEESGLTPDEVAELVHKGLPAALDKLAEYESTGLQPDEVRKLADAKAEGRLLELPCKVGDTLYWIEEDGVFDAKTLSFHADEYCQYYEDDNGNEFSTAEFAERIGKSVFLTRAEADAGAAQKEK